MIICMQEARANRFGIQQLKLWLLGEGRCALCKAGSLCCGMPDFEKVAEVGAADSGQYGAPWHFNPVPPGWVGKTSDR